MCGRVAFVYHGLLVDTIRPIHRSIVGTLFPAVMHQIVVDNRQFFMHQVHLMLLLILIVLSRHTSSDRDAAVEKGARVLPAFVDMHLANTFVHYFCARHCKIFKIIDHIIKFL